MQKRILLALMAMVISLTALTAFAQSTGHGSLRIRYFKIGKADAYLLRTDHHAVLIDAGEEDDGPEIAGFLIEKGVTKLDYLIISHFDKRSIGGLPEVLEAVDVDKVLVPEYEKDSNLYLFIRGLLDAENVEKVQSQAEFTLDKVAFTVLPAKSLEYSEDEDNNFSLVTLARHGDNSFFFAGDIMSQRINEMKEDDQLLPHTVLKLPCHGQNIDGLDILLDLINPKIAVIPASAKNPPAGAVISNLETRGIRWYSTMDGSVSLTSDGYGITVEQTRKIKE